MKFVESKGYYDGKSWEELENLSQSASDRANNLRRVMERLGISIHQEKVATSPEVTPHQSTPSTESETDVIEIPHLDPEGDNQAEQNQEV